MRLDLQQIVDSMPCGVLVLDCKGEISMINPESGRLLGLDGAHFPNGSKATLRQISALSGVNLESSYEDAASNDTGLEFCVNEPSGNVGSRFVIDHFSTSRAGPANPTGRS